MPLHMKSSDHIDSPQTLYDPSMDKIDFINDPDTLRDLLPQPYR